MKKRRGRDPAAGRALAVFLIVFSLFLGEQAWIRVSNGADATPVNPMRTAELAISATQPPLEVWSGEAEHTRLPVVFEEEIAAGKTEEDAVLTGVYPDVVEGFLPVCYGRRTSEAVVALTFDDCNQPGNLKKIIRLVAEYGGKATIFPIGENVEMLAPTLQNAVARGFEIENHTQTHSGLYWEDDEGLVYQIWQQNREVSEALGVDYQMHFLRPRGGDNRYDQRTHAYLRQMGYRGIAYWSQVGSGSTADQIMSRLRSGDIILFHTTDEDLATVMELIPRLYSRGFRMVTLNELYGLEENEQNELSDQVEPTPLQPYERFDQVFDLYMYSHDVYLIQERLAQMGFLTGKYNGYYGEKTKSAVKAFQRSEGLSADGVCGPATWTRCSIEKG